LLAKALCQVVVFLREYISISAVTAANGFAFTASHFRKALGYLALFQVTRRKGETNTRHHPNTKPKSPALAP